MTDHTIGQWQFEFDTYGFTVLERVLSEADARELADAVSVADDQIGTDYVHEAAYARHVMNLLACDERFVGLVDNLVVLAAVETILGPEVILGSMNTRILRPGDPVQPFHSDIPAQFRKAGSPVMMQAVWMLDAFTEDNGTDADRSRITPGRVRYSTSGSRREPLGGTHGAGRQRVAVQRPVLAWRRDQSQHRDSAGRIRALPGRALDAISVRSTRWLLRGSLGTSQRPATPVAADGDGSGPAQCGRLPPAQRRLVRERRGDAGEEAR